MKRYLVKIRSRHPSHNQLRGKIKSSQRAVVRFGSSTKMSIPMIEINSIESIAISANKKLMKQKFMEANVRQPDFITGNNDIETILYFSHDAYPIVAKNIYGSRGKGNTKINNEEALKDFINHRLNNLNQYIFEVYMPYIKEYRLHISEDGCFYTCRKMLKKEFKDKPNSWQRHDDNCVWILENNPLFEKPSCWDKIVADCVKALKQIGADFLAFDVRVQSEYNKEGQKRKEVDYVLIECNSAPSCHGVVVTQKYMEIIPKLIEKKYAKK